MMPVSQGSNQIEFTTHSVLCSRGAPLAAPCCSTAAQLPTPRLHNRACTLLAAADKAAAILTLDTAQCSRQAFAATSFPVCLWLCAYAFAPLGALAFACSSASSLSYSASILACSSSSSSDIGNCLPQGEYYAGLWQQLQVVRAPNHQASGIIRILWSCAAS